MLYYLFVFCSTALFCIGLTRFLKRPFFSFAATAISQMDILLNSSLSEDEKEGHLTKNLKSLLTHFAATLFFLILISIVAYLPTYLYVVITDVQEVDLTSWYFFLSMILGSLVLLFQKSKSDYSYWSKLLHTIILDNYNIGKYLFKGEKKRVAQNHPTTDDEFVIVTGLARAGTTAMTNILFESEQFHSISYGNMPLLIAPNLWAKVYKPKTGRVRERAHGDKVLFSENTIEALEEYFFKVFLNDEFIEESTLAIHEIEKPVYDSYLEYQNFFKKSDTETSYLAKNNNFILRYPSLREFNDKFKVVLVFRNPIDHAKSLLKQHSNFSQQQVDDPFVRSYMNWLGHHEFGLDQKVFEFGQEKHWEKYEKSSINYWLAIWINYYQFLLSLPNDENLFLIDYQDLLLHPEELKGKLGEVLNINFPPNEQELFSKRKSNDQIQDLDEEIASLSNNIHNELLNRKTRI